MRPNGDTKHQQPLDIDVDLLRAIYVHTTRAWLIQIHNNNNVVNGTNRKRINSST